MRESNLLGRTVQGDGFHAHGVAVLLGIALLEGGAAKLPRGHIPADTSNRLYLVKWGEGASAAVIENN